MKSFSELAEAITDRFAREMENLQDLFAEYLQSNLRTFLNNSEVLQRANFYHQELHKSMLDSNLEVRFIRFRNWSLTWQSRRSGWSRLGTTPEYL